MKETKKHYHLISTKLLLGLLVGTTTPACDQPELESDSNDAQASRHSPEANTASEKPESSTRRKDYIDVPVGGEEESADDEDDIANGNAGDGVQEMPSDSNGSGLPPQPSQPNLDGLTKKVDISCGNVSHIEKEVGDDFYRVRWRRQDGADGSKQYAFVEYRYDSDEAGVQQEHVRVVVSNQGRPSMKIPGSRWTAASIVNREVQSIAVSKLNEQLGDELLLELQIALTIAERFGEFVDDDPGTAPSSPGKPGNSANTINFCSMACGFLATGSGAAVGGLVGGACAGSSAGLAAPMCIGFARAVGMATAAAVPQICEAVAKCDEKYQSFPSDYDEPRDLDLQEIELVCAPTD